MIRTSTENGLVWSTEESVCVRRDAASLAPRAALAGRASSPAALHRQTYRGTDASLGEPASDELPAPGILIVGRHMLLAEALAHGLEVAGFKIIALAPDGGSGVATAGHRRPDVGVVDLGAHDTQGLLVGTRLVHRWPDIKLLALTHIDDPFASRAAAAEGFHGCMSKEAPLAQLVGAVRAVLAGHPVRVKGGRRGHLSNSHHGAGVAPRGHRLTPRERDVLYLLVQGYRSDEMAQALNVGLNTIRTHVQNILTKLHVHSRLEAASVAVEQGLVPPRAGASRDRAASPLIPLR